VGKLGGSGAERAGLLPGSAHRSTISPAQPTSAAARSGRRRPAPDLGEALLCVVCAANLFSSSLGCWGTPYPLWPPLDAAPLAMPSEFPASRFVAMRTHGHGDIPVFGSCDEESAVIEARWNGGAWASLGPCSGGRYGGMLYGQPAGFGTLEVRTQGGSVSRTVPDVGVGDVFAVVGQSNAVGMTSSLRGAAHAWASALPLEPSADGALFRHADDPLHVSSQWFGSAWPIFMDAVIEQTDAPVLLILTAQGATGLVSPRHWHARSERFLRTVNNISVGTGGTMRVTAVLYFQGESDAISGVSYESYKSALVTLVDALVAKLGSPAPVVVAEIGPHSAIPERSLARIRAAQRDAAAEHPSMLPGPCFADWVGDSARLHYVDFDAEGADGPGGEPGLVPERWLAAVRHLIGGAPATAFERGCGSGPG
jgi:hypothetical protein